MITKGLQELIAEASAVVESIDSAQAADLLGMETVVFIDVRESDERRQSYIPGSIHVPRGFLESIADPSAPAHNPALSSGKTLVVYCVSGVRSLLAAKTLQEMGIEKVYNLSGGIHSWSKGGGALKY